MRTLRFVSKFYRKVLRTLRSRRGPLVGTKRQLCCTTHYVGPRVPHLRFFGRCACVCVNSLSMQQPPVHTGPHGVPLIKFANTPRRILRSNHAKSPLAARITMTSRCPESFGVTPRTRTHARSPFCSSKRSGRQHFPSPRQPWTSKPHECNSSSRSAGRVRPASSVHDGPVAASLAGCQFLLARQQLRNRLVPESLFERIRF